MLGVFSIYFIILLEKKYCLISVLDLLGIKFLQKAVVHSMCQSLFICSYCSEPYIVVYLRLKYSWCHLESYSVFQDLSRRGAQMKPVIAGFKTRLNLLNSDSGRFLTISFSTFLNGQYTQL